LQDEHKNLGKAIKFVLRFPLVQLNF